MSSCASQGNKPQTKAKSLKDILESPELGMFQVKAYSSNYEVGFSTGIFRDCVAGLRSERRVKLKVYFTYV